MGILGVVVVLDEVELDVVLGTHLTKALGASQACVYKHMISRQAGQKKSLV